MIDITSELSKNENWYNYNKFVQTRKWDDKAISLVLCDISPSDYKPFYFGVNIIDKIVNNSRYNCGRAIWKHGNGSMEWYTKKSIKEFDVIGLGVYMYFQIFAIPAFLADNKIQPLAKYRKDSDPIIILGGQAFYLFNGYDKFIDIACIGEGEEWILDILEICEKYKGNRKKIIEEAASIRGSYCPEIHGTGAYPRITKRIIAEENLHNSLLDYSSIESKTTRKVIEIARGCKYNCGFCSLAKRMYPYRQNDIEHIKKTIDTFPPGSQIYPFAPDEASFSHHSELADWCNFKGYKYFRYNFRINTIKEEDIKFKNVANQVVFGVDGISQRIIDITNKNIKISKLLEISEDIFRNDYALLKLNYVFNYHFETDKDYEELEQLLRTLIEKRLAIGNKKTMIRIAPTPYIPEPFAPLNFLPIREDINSKFADIVYRIKKSYFDRGIIPMIKMNGLQGYENWFAAVVIHRLESLSELVYFAYKNNYKRSSFSNDLFVLILKYLKLKGIRKEQLFAELDIEKEYWFDKIDWSAGLLNDREIIRKNYLSIKRKINKHELQIK